MNHVFDIVNGKRAANLGAAQQAYDALSDKIVTLVQKLPVTPDGKLALKGVQRDFGSTVTQLGDKFTSTQTTKMAARSKQTVDLALKTRFE